MMLFANWPLQYVVLSQTGIKKIVIQFVHEFFRMGTGVSCVKTTKVEPFVYHDEDSTSTTGSRIIKIIQSLHQIY